MDIKSLEKHAEKLFSDRRTLDSLFQEIADHFYPERADFTTQRVLGTDFAAGLMSSFPLLVRRDLCNSFGSILRPAGKQWYSIGIDREPTYEERSWLEYATKVHRSAMYDPVAQFTRATKEGDHDYGTFGQTVLSVELNTTRTAMLYRCWHLRDVVWAEDENGAIGNVYRRGKMSIQALAKKYPGKLPDKYMKRIATDPYCQLDYCHAVVSADVYGDYGFSKNFPWISVTWIKEEGIILESTPTKHRVYVIPRWQTVSGSQYAHSPATVCGLADARLIQAMSRVILEAGEKYTNPPLIGVKEAVRGDVQMMAGGLTWVDAEYDERLGEVLRPLAMDRGGMNIGMELQSMTMQTLKDAFFLNQLQLPEKRAEMTAYEVSQYVSEYIRKALPLFEPVETEYNGGLCEETFEVLMANGAFGPIDTIPASLSRARVRFRFQSPLQNALDSEKASILNQATEVLSRVAAFEPRSTAIIDFKVALREALYGVQVPAKWLRSEQEYEDIMSAQDADEAAQKEVAALESTAKASKDLATAKSISMPAPEGVQ